jgi:toxin CptA
MHNAPAVTYPVGRSRFAAAMLGIAWLLGAATTLAWWAQSPSAGWRLVGACILLIAAAGCAVWNWSHAPGGTLTWDGEAWRCSLDRSGLAGGVEVNLDLQQWVLLRWSAGRASHWLWLERASCVERWDDLRRAVYSRARLEAPPEPERPAATP